MTGSADTFECPTCGAFWPDRWPEIPQPKNYRCPLRSCGRWTLSTSAEDSARMDAHVRDFTEAEAARERIDEATRGFESGEWQAFITRNIAGR